LTAYYLAAARHLVCDSCFITMFRLLEYNAVDVQCVAADVPCTQTCIKTVAIDPCTADIGFVCGVSCVMDKHSFIDRSFDQVSIDRLIGDRSDAMCMAYTRCCLHVVRHECVCCRRLNGNNRELNIKLLQKVTN